MIITDETISKAVDYFNHLNGRRNYTFVANFERGTLSCAELSNCPLTLLTDEIGVLTMNSIYRVSFEKLKYLVNLAQSIHDDRSPKYDESRNQYVDWKTYFYTMRGRF